MQFSQWHSEYIQCTVATSDVPCLIATLLCVCARAVRTHARQHAAYIAQNEAKLSSSWQPSIDGQRSPWQRTDVITQTIWRPLAAADGGGRLSSIARSIIHSSQPPPAGVKMKLNWLRNRRQISHFTVARWRVEKITDMVLHYGRYRTMCNPDIVTRTVEPKYNTASSNASLFILQSSPLSTSSPSHSASSHHIT